MAKMSFGGGFSIRDLGGYKQPPNPIHRSFDSGVWKHTKVLSLNLRHVFC